MNLSLDAAGGWERFLRSYPERCRPSGAIEPLGHAGGLSGSRFWRYRGGDGLLLIRAWPAGADRARVERIHGWLAKAAPGRPFVPSPVADLQGRTIHAAAGRLVQVEPWLRGTPADLGATIGEFAEAIAAIASLHEAWRDEGTEGLAPGLVRRRDALVALSEGGLDALRDRLARAIGEEAELARRWVARAAVLVPDLRRSVAREAERRAWVQPVLRDARAEHVLFDGGRLSGIVDYGAMAHDAPAADLARLWGEWPGARPSIDELARMVPSRESDAGRIAAYERAGALLGGASWVRWHFVEGRTFDVPGAVAAGLRRSLARIGG